MSNPAQDPLLRDLEGRMASQHLRGQWQVDASRPQVVSKGAQGQVVIEPLPAGKAHLWRWAELAPLLKFACEAMKESYTARRALVLKNPELQRGTTGTMVASFQIVRAGEIAWAHRHSINALRFAIEGGPKVFTIVDGRTLPMEPYDLILTPGWTWHDHHNEGDRDAIWMDGLDVPLTLALHQNFYEELGDMAQQRLGGDLPALLRTRAAPSSQPAEARPYRYPWSETLKVMQAKAAGPVDPYCGQVLNYVNPVTGGSVLPTINCQIEILPPGFDGCPRRTTASSISLVVSGEGRTVLSDRELDWGRHDCFAVPNWTWQRLVNRSSREPAILFTMSDTPLLAALGFYREETEGAPDAVARPAPSPLRPAAE